MSVGALYTNTDAVKLQSSELVHSVSSFQDLVVVWATCLIYFLSAGGLVDWRSSWKSDRDPGISVHFLSLMWTVTVTTDVSISSRDRNSKGGSSNHWHSGKKFKRSMSGRGLGEYIRDRMPGSLSTSLHQERVGSSSSLGTVSPEPIRDVSGTPLSHTV